MKGSQLILVLLMFFFGATSNVAKAQGRKKKPPKQENVQTPQNAMDKDKAIKAEKQGKYLGRRNHHYEIQDKATQKRMKENEKRALRISQGKDVPWYKRVFRKRKF
jgi:biopolymer transport protein ExbD